LLSSKKKKVEEEEMEKEKQREKKEEAEVVQKYKEDIDKYEHLKNLKKSKNKKEDKVSFPKLFSVAVFFSSDYQMLNNIFK
jgi:hypothetical protein